MDAVFVNSLGRQKNGPGYLSSQMQIFSNKYFSSKRMFNAKFKIYKFLEYPSGVLPNLYHLFLFIYTFIVFTLSILITIEEIQHDIFDKLYIGTEIVLVSFYIFEYCLRLWSCDIIESYRGKKRFSYVLTFPMIIDLIIIILNVVMIGILLHHFPDNTITIILLNFLQILRLVRSERHYGTISLMIKVLRRHQNELITGYCCGLLLIAFTSCLVYLSEKYSSETHVKTLADSVYLTFISFFTIGYGDIVPLYPLTKAIIILFAAFGIAFVALPSGIIGSGFAIEAANRARKKNEREIYKPAIQVIQSAIRNYLYQFEDSTTVVSDFKALKKHPKTAKLFFTKIKEYSREEAETSTQGIDKLYFTVSSGPEARKIVEKLNLGHTKLFGKYQSTEFTSDINEKFEKVAFLCCKLVRSLYLHAKIAKFKRIKYPGFSVDENLRLIQNRQENCAFYLNEIIKCLKTKIRGYVVSEHALHLPASQTKFVSQDIPTIQTISNREQIENMSKRVQDLENIVNDAIEKLIKQKQNI